MKNVIKSKEKIKNKKQMLNKELIDDNKIKEGLSKSIIKNKIKKTKNIKLIRILINVFDPLKNITNLIFESKINFLYYYLIY